MRGKHGGARARRARPASRPPGPGQPRRPSLSRGGARTARIGAGTRKYPRRIWRGALGDAPDDLPTVDGHLYRPADPRVVEGDDLGVHRPAAHETARGDGSPFRPAGAAPFPGSPEGQEDGTTMARISPESAGLAIAATPSSKPILREIRGATWIAPDAIRSAARRCVKGLRKELRMRISRNRRSKGSISTVSPRGRTPRTSTVPPWRASLGACSTVSRTPAPRSPCRRHREEDPSRRG